MINHHELRIVHHRRPEVVGYGESSYELDVDVQVTSDSLQSAVESLLAEMPEQLRKQFVRAAERV